MSIFQKVIFQGEAFMTWYKTPTQPSSSFFIEKDLKSKCWKKMSEPKTQKGGYIKGVKEEGGNEGGEYGASHFGT